MAKTDMFEMWTELDLTLSFHNELCGGVPRQKDIVEAWIATRTATNPEFERVKRRKEKMELEPPRSLEEIKEEAIATLDPLPDDVEEQMKKSWVGFNRDDDGLFVKAGNLRAHLKDCATVLGKLLNKGHDYGWGGGEPKQFAAKIKDVLYVKGLITDDRLHILDSQGNIIQQPTDYRDATLSVMTAQGPRTCLKRVDYIRPAVIKCKLQVLLGGEINRDHIYRCFQYGAVHGFGQDRSLQYGRYHFELGE